MNKTEQAAARRRVARKRRIAMKLKKLGIRKPLVMGDCYHVTLGTMEKLIKLIEEGRVHAIAETIETYHDLLLKGVDSDETLMDSSLTLRTLAGK